MNQFTRLNNEHLKEECLQYLGGKKCCVCSTDFLPIICYDFHHAKGAKERNISQMIQQKTMLDDELKRELDKCKVVCSNCHRQVTARLILIS